MHRKLPIELNLHILSFLSLQEALKINQVNKLQNNFTKFPSFWKTRLRDDFVIQHVKEIKNPRDEYKKLHQQLKAEKAFYLALMEAHLFSLEIKRCQSMDSAYINPEELEDDDLENITIQHARDHLYRLGRLDLTLLRSKKIFQEELSKLKLQHPEVDQEKIKIQLNIIQSGDKDKIKCLAESFGELDRDHLLLNLNLGLSKVDAYITMRTTFRNKDNFTQNTLNDLLHTACSFLHIESAKVLIKLGADINYFMTNYDTNGNYSETTPLYEAINAFYNQRVHDPNVSAELAKELIHFLLDNGADPQARIFISENINIDQQTYENQKKTIHEICIIENNSPNNITPEILNEIINASDNKKKEENSTRKRPRG